MQIPDLTTLRRLERIESLLEVHSEAIRSIQAASAVPRAAGTATAALPPVPSNSTVSHGRLDSVAERLQHYSGTPRSDSHYYSSRSISTASPVVVDTTTPDVEVPPLTIPSKHQTSTNALLRLPVIRSLVGDFPCDYFLRLESHRSVPVLCGQSLSQSALPLLKRDVTDLLVTTFFSAVYPCHPILDREAFLASYEDILVRGLKPDVESALCMVILALGAVASQPADFCPKDGSWAPGMDLFRPALEILIREATWFSKPSLPLVQGLIFGGVYSAYLAQPFHSWKLIHMASMNAQLLLYE